jgi:hypothetical protein
MGDDSSSGRSRRGTLAAAAAVAGVATVPGCAALWDQTGATDVVVDNAATGPRTVTVVITPDGAEEPHTSRTLALDPGETVDPVNRSKLPTNDGYTVEASVEDGPSETFEWSDPTLDLAPLWVRVDDAGTVTFLLQAG